MSKKPLVLDLSEAAGVHLTPLHIKNAEGRLMKFRVPERTDDERATMAQRLQECTTDAEARELAADWLLACSADGASRADCLALVRRDAALSQILTALLTGRLPDPKQMDQLLARLLDRLMGETIAAI